MSGFLKKQFGIRRTAAVTVVVTYLLVSCTIDLFHNESCQLGVVNAGTADVISPNDPCLACVFLAGSNSTEASYGTAIVSAESSTISQFLPYLSAINNDDWAYSIIPRAPPSITTS